MGFLFSSLLAVGTVTLTEPLAYMFAERRYRKNPEAEKDNSFELLDAIFRRKYTKAIFIAAGIVCFIAAITVFKLYVSPTL